MALVRDFSRMLVSSSVRRPFVRTLVMMTGELKDPAAPRQDDSGIPIRRVARAAKAVSRAASALKALQTPPRTPGELLGAKPSDANRTAYLSFARAEAELKLALDNTEEPDLGLDGEAWKTDPKWVKAVPIYEDDEIAMRLFIVPPYQVIPLHDHPEMLVYARLYRGDIHAFSMSWVDSRGMPKQMIPAVVPHGPFYAHCDFKGWITTPKATETVYPSIGNLHEFHAGSETCVFLDVFIPPYGANRVRHFYVPEAIERHPVGRRHYTACPTYGPNSVEPHPLSLVEVGTIVQLRHIADPVNYRITRMPYEKPARHFTSGVKEADAAKE